MELMGLKRGTLFLINPRLLHIIIGIALSIIPHATPSYAQSALQPGFDPRQAERRFDTMDAEQRRKDAKSLPSMPALANSGPMTANRPLRCARSR